MSGVEAAAFIGVGEAPGSGVKAPSLESDESDRDADMVNNCGPLWYTGAYIQLGQRVHVIANSRISMFWVASTKVCVESVAQSKQKTAAHPLHVMSLRAGASHSAHQAMQMPHNSPVKSSSAHALHFRHEQCWH